MRFTIGECVGLGVERSTTGILVVHLRHLRGEEKLLRATLQSLHVGRPLPEEVDERHDGDE